MRFLFIVIEGVDGSGKGTQIRLLEKALNEMGKKVFITCEPTSGEYGVKIRKILSGEEKSDSCELAALFLADRIYHCQNESSGIKRMLDLGYTVLCDRYYYSSFAYQGLGTSLEWVLGMNLDCPAVLKPDLTVFLDLPAAECDRRIEEGRSSREIFEKLETIKAIRGKYLEVFERIPDHNVKIINASGSPETVSKRIIEAVKESIPL